MSQVQMISIRLTQDEKEVLEVLAEYLHGLGVIPSPTISDALRYCLYFTLREVVKSIEAERYGR